MKNKSIVGYSIETRQFLHGKRADYCIYGDGSVTRTWKVSMVEERVRPYMHKGKLMVKCGQQEFTVKHLVAWAFLENYEKGDCIICVDRDERNCAVENLCVMKSRQLGKLTGHLSRSCPVFVRNNESGQEVRYRSVREGAKALHCSYQTLFNYIKKEYKNSCLSKYTVKVGV